MAARDRFGGFGEPATTPLQRYILNACDPQNFEPNLALNLEIADTINAKKGNAPREAAVAIVHYINHRNPNVSMLALNLLDICVKNCGYPFHLQISTKEFLNELVRRFPERPPMHATRSQQKILELIEEWRQTICQTSRYKEDLGFIRDMHRLLSYKGYAFPAVRREDAAVLNPSDNLRSAEEMEEEEKAAQSAKLQELIRRGGPHDLQEANKLMKVMAGFDTRNKTDYRAKAAEEVGKIQQKAKLLEEMLQGYKPGDEIKEGDVFQELASALQNAHPKIKKMCEEESEDQEAVAKLLEINDSINRTIERYRLIKKGDIEAASRIPKGTLGTSGAGVQKGPDNELSLIDFGGPDDIAPTEDNSTAAPPAPPPKGNALEDDLLGLSIGGGGTYGQTGGISLGMSTNNGAANPTSSFQQQTYQPSQSQANHGPPIGFMSNGAASQTFTASQPFFPTQNQQIPTTQHVSKASDPFAALTSPSTRQSSPFQFHQSATPIPQTANSNSLLDIDTGAALTQTQPTPAAGTDDEWTFSSALPDTSSEIVVTSTSVNITFHVSRQSDDVILINSRASNNTPQPVSDFTFQLAVTKGYTLKLEPQSSRMLSPSQSNGITQTIRLHGVEQGRGNAVKIRWKVSYLVGGVQRKDESGEISNLGVA
ncbi:ADP-ribosylation factor-binding protein-like protein GGA1 [Pseudovirgaria hyperparasitica]|uniref:ADP-ribosylation factor-binding protein-like protein GGA1 n=1 Tax=Pseudovirgaria hyperparasitica TaxID=470096 RepID=A0A6A6W9K9_9PEZI|nr:ADP-ribosylation factor-binding protein-like protein GGA1 [Pseudovirgaria hyperparasitica]KAF2758277.1 ADP-ribosylation factor-binding protein-like protein GGA1 [Pseudovirgaria hyperparasitica]